MPNYPIDKIQELLPYYRKSIQASQLSCPLDIHSGKVARKPGLFSRAQNDARAVEELDRNLRRLDSADPVKYDFALFGLGVFEHF